ncbi:MAG: hypothetical protein JXB46_07080 [Candidatus Eisenbacteria bacterium]|nr:hypothetical protein [Candidatus Eisenbacteria bacterium]
MKRLMLVCLLFAFALLVVQPASADSAYQVGMNGSGSLMMSPVVYSGNYMFGLVGSWEITLDDSLWPSAADSTARFNYIWDHFFAANYNNVVGGEHWLGYFNSSTLTAPPHFRFDLVSPAGVMEGDITFTVLVRDWYADGILSQSEKHRNLNLSATLSINPDLGTGEFEDLCGHGSVSSGNFNFVNPPTLDVLQLVGQIQTYTCPSPVEDTTWGAIKALFD